MFKTLQYKDADEHRQGAAVNAYYRNRELAHTYTPAQQCLAQRALDLLDTAFRYHRYYINYRKQFIAVKLEGQIARTRKLGAEALDILASKGYEVVTTAQGLVVRIPR